MKLKSNNYKLSALDTETVGGYAVILATEARKWEAHSFEECVHPLFSDIAHGRISGRIMMWNQKYDSQAILKYLPDDNIWDLINTNETIYNERYKILYIQNKVLRIRDQKLKISASCYDIAQFYNYMHLDDAGKKYVNDQKLDNEITHEITERAQYHTDNELYWIFAHHLKEIQEYCQQDATLTYKLGFNLVKEIKDLFNLQVKTYASRSVFAKEMIKRTVGYMDYEDKRVLAYPKFLPDSRAGRMARYAYHGGIFDCKKRGWFDECTDIDISSAYPFQLQKLPHWSNGDFVEVIDWNAIRKTDVYGWLWCKFNYPMIPYTMDKLNTWEEFHKNEPVTVSATNLRKYYPTGERWQCITLIEARFLDKHGYLLNCAGGYVWRHNPKKRQYPSPFGWINDVYKQKQEIKRTEGKQVYKYDLIKRPLNSAYGVTAQKKGIAQYRNFFYASSITAGTRVQIDEMLEEIGYDSYITIATDGILLEGEVHVPQRFLGSGLGSWDVGHWDHALVVANGVYQLMKEDEPPKYGTRGMLSFHRDLLELLKKHQDESSFVPNTKPRPVTMYQSMRFHKYTRDDMNRFMPISRTLSCNGETSKVWEYIPNFGDMLTHKYTGRRFSIDELENQ